MQMRILCCMNMHSLAEILFDKLNHEVGKAYEVSATKCTKRAAEEYGYNTSLETTTICAKFDEVWQKREYASLNGYVSEVVGKKMCRC